MLIGYARVSTKNQNLMLQIDALKEKGCCKIYSDISIGTNLDRLNLNKAIDFLKFGDTLVVWKIDRLGRSLSHLMYIIEILRKKGVGFLSLGNPEMDINTRYGQLLFNIFATLADFERDLISDRIKAGLKMAKKQGKKIGRSRKMTDDKLKKAIFLIKQGFSVRETALKLDVGKSSLYKFLGNFKANKPLY